MSQILLVTKNDKDVHRITSDIQCVLTSLQQYHTIPNWNLIRQHYLNLDMSDNSTSTIRKTMRDLNRIFQLSKSNKNITELKRKDVDNILFELRLLYPKGTKDNSYFNHVTTLKIFLRWVFLGNRLFKTVGDPHITSHIRLTKPKTKVQQKHLITFTEYKKMINSITTKQYRALLAISFECGVRTAELLTINREDVLFDELGAVISVDGKTGKRDIRVMRATRYLYEWYHDESLPTVGPLFIMTGKSKFGNRMSVLHAANALKKIAKGVDITKRITFQINRHSGATIASGMISESQMKQQFGWSKNSMMPSVYVHLSGSNVDNGYEKYYNLPSKNNEDLKLFQCSTCYMLYEKGDVNCVRCGKNFE